MGFFSSLFKKKENAKPVINLNPTVKTCHTPSAPEIPPYQGDYAKTVFLWAHDKAAPIKSNDSYARYFMYECGINNPAKFHRELIDAGYFVEATVEQMLAALKVSELKEILTVIGQPTTGKKDVLIECIVNNASGALISKYCPERLYILSELGETFLQEHNDYVMVHKHKSWGVGWKEYDAHKISGRSYYDTMWAIFNEQLANGPRDFGRNQYLCMYQLLKEEEKRIPALEMLLRVLYIDLSGVEGMQWYDMYRQGLYKEKDVRECFSIAIMTAPGILNPIKEFSDVYSDELVDRIYEQRLPVQVCDKKLFLSIVHSILDGTYEEAVTAEKLKKAYYKYVRENLFMHSV